MKNEQWKKQKQKQGTESIRVSMTNTLPRSWDQAIFIERKSKKIKKAQYLIKLMFKVEIKKNQCKRQD